MKHTITASVLVCAATFLGLAASPALALTPPALQLSDTAGNVVTIDSTGTVTFSTGCACTTQAVAVAAGTITWSGTIGNFNVSNVNGSSKPVLAFPTMDTSMGFLTSTNGGTLNVSYTDTGFAGTGPTTMSNLTSIIGTGSASFTSYFDNTNVAFGTGTLIGNNTPNQTITGPSPTTALFSMTEKETFAMAPGDIFIIDDGLQATAVALSAACPAASGKSGTAYSSSVTAAGGLPPYTFALTSGALPAGLTLNPSTGLIGGTPSASGLFSFDVTVTDASGGKAVTGGCGMSVAAGGGTGQGGMTLACPANLSGVAGTKYASSIAGANGLAPYMYSIGAGALPYKLYLNATTGAITGTPTTAGTFTVTFKAADSTKPTAQSATSSACAYTVTTPPPPVTVYCADSKAKVGVAYSSKLTASGGTAPYTFSIVGKLPAGLTLNPTTGVISGTPAVAGNYNFTSKVTDSKGATDTDAGGCNSGCNISVSPAASLVATCAQGSAQVGVAYKSAIGVTGGVAPYKFAVTGTLPPGLILNATTGAVTGTPTTSGKYLFTTKVTDSVGATANQGSCSGGCEIDVKSATTTVTVDCPWSTATAGDSYDSSGPAHGGSGSYTWSISSGSLPDGLCLDSRTGKITGKARQCGTYTFKLKATDDKGNSGTSANCTLSVRNPENNDNGNDGSDNTSGGWGGWN